MNKSLKEGLHYTHLGLTMVVITAIGLGLGYYVDGYFHTGPWGTLVGLVAGFVLGFVYFVLEIVKLVQGGRHGDDGERR